MKLKTSLRFLALLSPFCALITFALAVQSARPERSPISQKTPNISSPHTTLVAQSAQSQSDKRSLKSYGVLRFDADQVGDQVRRSKRLTLKTAQQTFDLELEENNLLAAQYRAEEVVAGGSMRAVARPTVRTYKGKINGREDTAARLTLTPQLFEGVLIADGEKYFIEPREKTAAGETQGEFIFYKESDVIERDPATCDVTLPARIDHAAQAAAAQSSNPIPYQTLAANAGIGRNIEIATEADYEYVMATGGSSAAANNAILSILNIVEETFESQLGISFIITYQHSWATAGDPYQSTVPSTVLTEFRNYWNTNFTSFNRDLAHMWTGKDLDGNTAGIAYVSVACQNPTASYGVSQHLKYDYEAMIGITAHEIGHNLGASHPDAQQPPVADCANSIMGKTAGSSQSFCQFSLNEITSYITSNGSCLQPAFSISGQVIGVTDGSNSTMSLTGSQIDSAVIFQDGRFSFSGLPPGTYTLTPTHNQSQYTYTPAAQTITISNSSVSEINFTASAITFNLTGRVTNANGHGLGGINIELDNQMYGITTTRTNADGAYLFTNLLVSRTFFVTARNDQYVFNPQNHFIHAGSPPLNGLDFMATARPSWPLPPQTSSFMLLSDGASERALALDSITRTREPFSVINGLSFVADRRTRVALYALNLSLLPGENFASVVTCQLEDAQGRIFAAPVEYVGAEPSLWWLTQVVVRLPDEAAGRGELRVRLNLRGTLSNQAMIHVQ